MKIQENISWKVLQVPVLRCKIVTENAIVKCVYFIIAFLKNICYNITDMSCESFL